MTGPYNYDDEDEELDNDVDYGDYDDIEDDEDCDQEYFRDRSDYDEDEDEEDGGNEYTDIYEEDECDDLGSDPDDF